MVMKCISVAITFYNRAHLLSYFYTISRLCIDTGFSVKKHHRR